MPLYNRLLYVTSNEMLIFSQVNANKSRGEGGGRLSLWRQARDWMLYYMSHAMQVSLRCEGKQEEHIPPL